MKHRNLHSTTRQPFSTRDETLLQTKPAIFGCRHCGEVSVSATSPFTDNCETNGHHDWVSLGTPGNTSYRCIKCEILVSTQSIPSSWGCSQAGFHSWLLD